MMGKKKKVKFRNNSFLLNCDFLSVKDVVIVIVEISDFKSLTGEKLKFLLITLTMKLIKENEELG